MEGQYFMKLRRHALCRRPKLPYRVYHEIHLCLPSPHHLYAGAPKLQREPFTALDIREMDEQQISELLVRAAVGLRNGNVGLLRLSYGSNNGLKASQSQYAFGSDHLESLCGQSKL